jgi:hypothetical protein
MLVVIICAIVAVLAGFFGPCRRVARGSPGGGRRPTVRLRTFEKGGMEAPETAIGNRVSN